MTSTAMTMATARTHEDVWFDAIVIAGELATRPTQPCLDLVRDEQNIVTPASLVHLFSGLYPHDTDGVASEVGDGARKRGGQRGPTQKGLFASSSVDRLSRPCPLVLPKEGVAQSSASQCGFLNTIRMCLFKLQKKTKKERLQEPEDSEL